eukprot:RCo043793
MLCLVGAVLFLCWASSECAADHISSSTQNMRSQLGEGKDDWPSSHRTALPSATLRQLCGSLDPSVSTSKALSFRCPEPAYHEAITSLRESEGFDGRRPTWGQPRPWLQSPLLPRPEQNS